MSLAGNVATGPVAAEDAFTQKRSESRVMDASSSSKVTVEYHDPSGLFPLIQEQLTSRFPLRNLHWKSPNRPLRSIDSLHVDLVPSKDSVHISGVTSPGLAPPDGSQTLTPGNGAAGAGTDHIRPQSKERRHQIPGLRQTPYLKVYLLRCDDSDSYKSTARKQLRDWVKTHTPPSQSSASTNTQENHDAFEWMIIHVVIPDTPAASQPRGSASSSAAVGDKEKSTGASRWTRGTTTILEKIRADFNIPSKSAPDRVAQVRLQKDAVPPHMLPVPSSTTGTPISESPQEQENAWNDIIVKFKTLILLSFDLRVSQYEEDIREKDSQRVLPGWNFCTFFMLKEGLARGFESVGLVEDALMGYDELSVGLDSVIRDQATEGGGSQGGTILSYTEDIFQDALEIYKRSEKEVGGPKEPLAHIHDARPLDSRKKNYRDLILSNKISNFDFRCYIFSRQMSLLLRLGNAHSARSDLASKLQPRPNALNRSASVDDVNPGTKPGSHRDDSEDLISLAVLCSRALNFITSAGRLLRDDILQGAIHHEVDLPQTLIDNLIHSWTFSALQQIIEETATSSLPISRFMQDMSTSSSSKMQPYGDHSREQKLSFAEPKTMIHPTRSSSLRGGRSSSADPPYAQTPASGQVVYEDSQYQERSAPRQDGAVLQTKTGLQELASSRAQLYVVQRRILEHIGKAFGWAIGWEAIMSHNSEKAFSDIDLDGEGDSKQPDTSGKEPKPMAVSTAGLSAAAIVKAVSSTDQFRQHYEALSDLIVMHYMAAGQTKAAESILGDLAALRYEMGDYAAAAMYFGRMASFFAENRWNLIEGTMLQMYAQSLKRLNRKDEYIRTLLSLLSKSAANRKRIRRTDGTAHSEGSAFTANWLDDDRLDTTGVLSQLIEYSEQLPYDKTTPMGHYFDHISVEPYIRHYDDKDGFQLRLQFRHVLEDEVDIDKARILLVSAVPGQAKEIWLESSEPLHLKGGVCRMWLSSNMNTIGPYLVDKILLLTKRIVFCHEPSTKAETTTPLGIVAPASAASLKAAKKTRIFCFPRIEAFRTTVYASHFIHIDQRRSIELQFSSGWNNIEGAEIRLRSASAGLRLRTANTTVIGGDINLKNKQAPGIITIMGMPSDTSATLQIPYEVESMLPELSIKVEVEYVTDKGQFQYYSSFAVPVELPLDVNVHDHFKNGALFSKFNIKTASQMPLEIIDVGLDGSEEYDVHAPNKTKRSVTVFPRQPMAVTYKITTREGEKLKSKNNNTAQANTGSLALAVVYRCLQEDVLDRLVELFAAAVENSPVERLARLLIASFRDRLEHQILPSQLEKVALLEKVDLGPFENMGWSECIGNLSQGVRETAQAWLQSWHQQHRYVFLPPAATDAHQQSPVPGSAPPSSRPPRRIIITVSIPQTHILHTASLSLTSPEKVLSYSRPIAVAGQPLAAELRIKHTRRWGSRAKLAALANLSKEDDAVEFVYTLEASPDTWLVAGQRRSHFSAKEGEEYRANVVLVPLKAGIALLPNIDIRARISTKGDRGEVAGGEQVVCETDYLSYGESVVVVPDVKRSTIGVGEVGSARGAVWLE